MQGTLEKEHERSIADLVERSLADTVVSSDEILEERKPLGTNKSVQLVASSVVDPVGLASFCLIGIGIQGLTIRI